MKDFRSLRFGLAILIAAFAMRVPPAAHASITTSGDFQTGMPTPTFSFGTPISLLVTTSGSLSYLVLDEWITSNGTRYDLAPSPVGQTFFLQINDGPTQPLRVSFLTDDFNSTAAAFTPNDGYLVFTNPVAVSAGDKVTILPGLMTFSSNAAFIPPPAVFNGNVFLASFPGARLSNLASANTVPEPSTWAMLGLGVVGAGAVALRRRKLLA